MTFTPRPEHELYALGDDALVAYGRAAIAAGNAPAARTALALLVYGMEADVRRRVAIRVPAHAIDEVAHDVLVRAVGAAFDGSSVGEFRSWMNTILARAAADYFRRAGRRPKEVPLPDGGDDEDGRSWRAEPAVDSEAGAVELGLVVDEVLESMDERHREVIQLHVFDGLPASAVCDRIDGMTEANVAQIASRFRARLRAELEPGGGGVG